MPGLHADPPAQRPLPRRAGRRVRGAVCNCAKSARHRCRPPRRRHRHRIRSRRGRRCRQSSTRSPAKRSTVSRTDTRSPSASSAMRSIRRGTPRPGEARHRHPSSLPVTLERIGSRRSNLASKSPRSTPEASGGATSIRPTDCADRKPRKVTLARSGSQSSVARKSLSRSFTARRRICVLPGIQTKPTSARVPAGKVAAASTSSRHGAGAGHRRRARSSASGARTRVPGARSSLSSTHSRLRGPILACAMETSSARVRRRIRAERSGQRSARPAAQRERPGNRHPGLRPGWSRRRSSG